MKKYLIALFALLTFVYPCFAVEQTEEEYEEVELNAFGYPENSFVKMIENNSLKSDKKVREKPACDDKHLSKSIREVAEPFVDSSAITIINKRRNILITKNIDNFSEISLDEAYNMDNKIIKARLVELKVNKRLSDKNFKICQSDNKVLRDKLYILMYDDNDNVMIELLNLAVNGIPAFYFYDK